MKYQSLFSGKINLLPAELAQRVVKVRQDSSEGNFSV